MAGIVGIAPAVAASTAASTGAAVASFLANIALQIAIGQVAQSLLVRKGRDDGATDDLLGLPVNNTDPGAPRIWAIGQRVRVPMQVMWQSPKVTETSPRVKGKATGITSRHTAFDCAFLLNDRFTSRLSQMIVNDGLLTWDTLNLISLRTHAMTATESAGQITLTMDSTADPDFALVFEAGDMVELAGFVVLSGPNPNGRYWEVISTTGHTSTPATLVIEPRAGQTTTSLNVTAGTAFDPASVTRIDDALVIGSADISSITYANSAITIVFAGSMHHDPSDVFRPGDSVLLHNITNGPTSAMGVFAVNATQMTLGFVSVFGALSYGGTSTDYATVEFATQPHLATAYLSSSFIPADHFYQGTETQTEDADIVAEEGSGNVSGFRGQAYQVLTEFDATNFGGVMPPMTEAVIDPDDSMTWAQAFQAVCERHGLSPSRLDTEGVNSEPFLGYYLRGPTQGARALQQLLLLKQVATQDRNGTVAFFAIDNADTVAINNGALFSDFAATVGDKPGTKLQWGEINDRDLPTRVGVRFQDPDSGYGENYIEFGLRHPSARGEENRSELDMKNVVLTKKDARNFAATVARRARINARPVAFTLPASYLHVLENDLLTFTDDEGDTHLVRVTRRDVGANLLVRIEAVVERANVQVDGSPVQSGAGSAVQIIYTAAELSGVVFDSPPVQDAWGLSPGVHAAVCAKPGSTWAGATLYMSQDGGANWQFVDTVQQEHAVGVLDTALASASPSETLGTTAITWDTTNTVDLELDSTGPLALSTLTDQDVLDGWNWFAILNGASQVVEVFGAVTVTQNTATNYTLSRLLRGVRGTWQGCAASHAAGLRVVGLPFFFPLSGKFVSLPGATANQQLAFKFVPPGKDLATVGSLGLTTTRRNASPFALRDITKSIGASPFDVTFTAAHWTRTNIDVGAVGPYPLDEPFEAYRFTLHHASGNGQAMYVRTKSAQGSGANTLRDPSVTFTAAEQTAAGYTPSASTTFYIDVQQVGQFGVSPSTYQVL